MQVGGGKAQVPSERAVTARDSFFPPRLCALLARAAWAVFGVVGSEEGGREQPPRRNRPLQLLSPPAPASPGASCVASL